MELKELKLKNGVVLKNNVLAAPMAGWTDVGFRSVAYEFGAGLCFTEMISAKALVYENKKTFEMLATEPNEKPIAVQLFGSEPEDFAKAVKLDVLQKFDIIDINMGCPAPKIFKNGEGSFLMGNIDLARQIVRSTVQNTNKPVSVKFRLGVDDKHINAVEFAKMCEEEGASFITIHGRTKEQMFAGEINYETLNQCVKAVKIPVFVNGGIKSLSGAEKAIEKTGAFGVMIGTGVIGNFKLLGEITKTDAKLSVREQILKQIEILKKYFSAKYVILNMRKHIAYFAKGLQNSSKIVKQVMQIDDIEGLETFVAENFE